MGRKKKNFNYNPRDVQIAQVQVTPIFYRNMYSTADIVANRGSAGSSKSHSVLQTLVYRFCEQPDKKILILRKTLPSMRLSTLMHLHKIFKEFGISNKVKEEKVTLNYYNNSKASKGYGNLIHLGSVYDKEKIKCVKPETDVLTINGFKNIKKIKVGDKVPS
jgi:phage terminase large subunit